MTWELPSGPYTTLIQWYPYLVGCCPLAGWHGLRCTAAYLCSMCSMFAQSMDQAARQGESRRVGSPTPPVSWRSDPFFLGIPCLGWCIAPRKKDAKRKEKKIPHQMNYKGRMVEEASKALPPVQTYMTRQGQTGQDRTGQDRIAMK